MPDRHTEKRVAMLRSLETRTGQSIDDWVEVLAACPSRGFMDRVAWLKAGHGLGHFHARLVVEVAREGDRADPAGDSPPPAK